jgi:hypothetical protein
MKLRPVPCYFGLTSRLIEPLALATVTPGQALHRQVQPPPMIRQQRDRCVTAPGGSPSPDKMKSMGKSTPDSQAKSSGRILETRNWGNMKHSWKSQVLVFSLTAILLAGAAAQDQPQSHERTYPTFAVDVPFKFNVGHRTFNAGRYQFILLGPGLLALCDLQKKRMIATLLTRQMQTATVPAATKVVFTNDQKYARLTSILLEHQAQGLEVLGEEVAIRQNPAAAVPRSLLDLWMPPPSHTLRPPTAQ